ncbi:MAG TPA: 30S ribosomal protein S8 [bacterium]|nr:30S ribosomal protein S8 [bacterium]
MTITDPIADMLTRIRNAQAVKKKTVKIPFSKVKFKIARILAQEGFVGEVKKRGKKARKSIEIELKYLPDKSPFISSLKRISKPGCRIYAGWKELKPKRGILIVSTSKGIMTHKEARRLKIGGEVLCEVY